MADELKRIEPLDSLRGLAALLVLVYHVKFIFQLAVDPYSDFVIAKLALGVPLFFVLSSFSIFYSLHGKEFSVRSIQYYFIRRFFRIAPLYYSLLLVYFFFHHQSLLSFKYLSTLILNLSFAFGFSPQYHEGLVAAGWSIGIEFLIYFILPVLFCLIQNYKTAVISLALIFVVSILLAYEYGASSYAGESYSYKHIAVMLPFFFLGITVFWVYESEKLMQFISANKYVMLFLALIGVFLIYGIYYYQLHYTMYVNFINCSKIYVYTSMFCFLFLILLQLSNPISVFHNRFFNFAGKLSYSIYLVHPLVIFSSKPVYKLFYSVILNPSAAFYVCLLYTLVVVLGLSFFAYSFVESKGIDLGKSLIRKLTEKNAR